MDEAIEPKPESYPSFNAFFTRRIKLTHHKRDDNLILSPINGCISQIGRINQDHLIQAKGISYSLNQLLAADPSAELFQDGYFATLYLSPRDYHRLHMPISGKLIKSIYVPGDLFAVNTASVHTVKHLFARNERFISFFETELGIMAKIMVGAIFVGSMETVWLGQITPSNKRELRVVHYDVEKVTLTQGNEFGHFNMGSTAILIFQKNRMRWLDELQANRNIRVGEVLGQRQDHH